MKPLTDPRLVVELFQSTYASPGQRVLFGHIYFALQFASAFEKNMTSYPEGLLPHTPPFTGFDEVHLKARHFPVKSPVMANR
jgi:hypothetical protein